MMGMLIILRADWGPVLEKLDRNSVVFVVLAAMTGGVVLMCLVPLFDRFRVVRRLMLPVYRYVMTHHPASAFFGERISKNESLWPAAGRRLYLWHFFLTAIFFVAFDILVWTILE